MTKRIDYENGYWISASDFTFRFTVPGPPAVLKNRKVIAPIGKPCPRCKASPKRTLTDSKRAKQWMQDATKALALQWPFKQALPKDILLHAIVRSYMPTKRRCDLDNSFGAPLDALQDAGVIEDDVAIRSLDGSRVLICREQPRVEIVIAPVVESVDANRDGWAPRNRTTDAEMP